ncbi:MAG: FG-GAP repeat domain-containing protein, partial [Isosphaeraceae bacterium]
MLKRLLPGARFMSLLFIGSAAIAAEPPAPLKFKMQEVDPNVGNVCYALTTTDVNGDGKVDLVALTENAIVWYGLPDWKPKDIIRNRTEKDNVCIQPLDIDGDGRMDFALGAAWRPTDTATGGTLQWVRQPEKAGDPWTIHPLGNEPTMHRLRFGDVLGTGKPQLVTAPLQGRGTKAPKWNEGNGVRIQIHSIPGKPETESWPTIVADDSLHTTHNLQIVDFDGNGTKDILLCAWEGVFVLTYDKTTQKFTKTKIGTGNQSATPFRGASEIKLGRLKNGQRYVATIEPWHGFQVVIYTEPGKPVATAMPAPEGVLPEVEEKGLWTRSVIAQPVTWGHGVWTADLDGDGDDELVIGQRDKNKGGNPAGPGVYLFDPVSDGKSLVFHRQVIDDGGIASEDVIVEDFNGDGRPDIAAGGRATHNVRIYWNMG